MSTKQGLKSDRNNLGRPFGEKSSRQPVEHREPGFRGDGAQSANNMNSRRSSDLVQKSEDALFVQNSPPENNIVQEVGFDDRRVYLAHYPWSKALPTCDRLTTAV